MGENDKEKQQTSVSYGETSSMETDTSASADAGSNVSLRERLGVAMVSAVEWGEQHKVELRWAALATTVGSAVVLLYSHSTLGFRRYSALNFIPARMMGATAPRLPVLLHSCARRGQVTAAQVLHYPLLLRLWDRYWRVPSYVVTHKAHLSGELLTVHFAAARELTPDGFKHLRDLPRHSVHKLRLLCFTEPADELFDEPAPLTEAPQQTPKLLGSGGGSGRWLGSLLGRSKPNTEERAVVAVPQLEPADPALQVETTASQEEEQEEEEVLWGELYAARERLPWSPLWWRRDDVCEGLLARGQAVLAEAEDLDWLGVAPSRVARLQRAQRIAATQGIGLWEQYSAYGRLKSQVLAAAQRTQAGWSRAKAQLWRPLALFSRAAPRLRARPTKQARQRGGAQAGSAASAGAGGSRTVGPSVVTGGESEREQQTPAATTAEATPDRPQNERDELPASSTSAKHPAAAVGSRLASAAKAAVQRAGQWGSSLWPKGGAIRRPATPSSPARKVPGSAPREGP